MREVASDEIRLRELQAELECVRRDRDAANLRLVALRLANAMARRESEEFLSRMRLAFVEARDRVQQLEASTIWRLTSPLRAVLRGIRGEPAPAPLVEPVEAKPPAACAPPRSPRPSAQSAPRLDLPQGPSHVAVLLAGNGDAAGLARCVASAQLALHRAGSPLDITVAQQDALPPQIDSVRQMRWEGPTNLARAHHLLLQDGFARGAEVCVIADPRGLFHPDAIRALLGVLARHGNRALVDAVHFPDAHPKNFDPLTFETPWADTHCLAISREAFDALGGFDEELGGANHGAALSHRAKSLDWPVLTAPQALFLIDRTDEARGEAINSGGPSNVRANPLLEHRAALETGQAPAEWA